MSGIAGVYYLDNRPVDRHSLEHMLVSLVHRGGDGCGLWHDGPVGLGHQMLRTTPESLQENLPLTNVTGDLTITCDARLDNRAELIAALDMAGRRPDELPDGELILTAYERWGDRCPERLLGDFAFAIWDPRRQVVFCARDHFGVKPFYYYASGALFAFASEIKALLALPEVPRRLDEVRLADYLVPVFEDRESTLYQGVLRLPPAHALTVGRESQHTEVYWTPDRHREVRLGSIAEYDEAFRHVFTEAVRCRLRAVGPIGSRLSGGQDSSSVVCVGRDILIQDGRQPLHTFSGIYDDVPVSDERRYINAVVRQGNVEPHYVHPDRLGPLHDWEAATWIEDEPLWNPHLQLIWGLCEAARQHEVRVLLGGEGGDDVVGHGHVYLAELLAGGRWLKCFAEAVLLKEHLRLSLGHAIRLWAVSPLLPPWLLRVWRALRRRNNALLGSAGVPIRPDFAQRVGLHARVARLHDEGPTRTVRDAQWMAITSGANCTVLEHLDRVTALCGIEPRYPFYDRRLAELCLALPPDQKLDGGWSRWIMRRSLNNVPDEVRWRTQKASLFPAIRHGLLRWDRAQLDDLLVIDPDGIAAYVDVHATQEMYRRYLAGSDVWDPDGYALWLVAVMGRWLRRTGLGPENGRGTHLLYESSIDCPRNGC